MTDDQFIGLIYLNIFHSQILSFDHIILLFCLRKFLNGVVDVLHPITENADSIL